MKLNFDADTQAFRKRFSDWLDANMPAEAEADRHPQSSADVPEWAREWQRKMFDAGWLMPGNPPEFGGQNASLLEQFVYLEELSARGINQSFNPQGLGIIASSILSFGTEEQKHKWAVPLMRAEITAALGMSEPNAGSDLAGLQTRAMLDGDHFVVNGQKVWTSGAHDADLIFAFVRTDPDAPKHKGLSTLIIPTNLPGITRRPFGSIESKDHLDFNEVFFDDVIVPKENLVGELNNGWRVANGALGHERSMLWLMYASSLDGLVRDAKRELAGTEVYEDPEFRNAYADLYIDAHALRLLGYRAIAKTLKGMEPREVAILKLMGADTYQQACLKILEAVGADGFDQTHLTAPKRYLGGSNHSSSWFDRYITTFGSTISGGTSEIQRNIIAEKVLGLPR